MYLTVIWVQILEALTTFLQRKLDKCALHMHEEFDTNVAKKKKICSSNSNPPSLSLKIMKLNEKALEMSNWGH